MSVQCITRVWNEAPYGGAALLALLALADFSDDHGRSYPAVGTVARKCRLSVSGVQKLMRILEQDGWVHVDFNAGPHGSNVYTLTWAAGVDSVEGSIGSVAQSTRSVRDPDLLIPPETQKKEMDPSGSGVRRVLPFDPYPYQRDHGSLEQVIRRY